MISLSSITKLREQNPMLLYSTFHILKLANDKEFLHQLWILKHTYIYTLIITFYTHIQTQQSQIFMTLGVKIPLVTSL